MFDGRDYHRQFEDACEKLAIGATRDGVRRELEQLEWILWEAIRGTFFVATVLPALAVSALVGKLLWEQLGGLWSSILSLIAVLALTTVGYWFLRLVFWLEISRHVRGRTFGR